MNKVPVLDKGHVAMLSASMPRNELKRVQNLCFNGKLDIKLIQLPTLHIEIKCPIFVQLALLQGNLTSINIPTTKLEAYIPSVDEVAAGDLETSEAIHSDLKQTTDALLINPKAYQMDGCDTFVSQTIAPISIYNTAVVSGNLSDWIAFIKRSDLPTPIEQYRLAITDIILAEWDFIWELIDDKKKKKTKRR